MENFEQEDEEGGNGGIWRSIRNSWPSKWFIESLNHVGGENSNLPQTLFLEILMMHPQSIFHNFSIVLYLSFFLRDNLTLEYYQEVCISMKLEISYHPWCQGNLTLYQVLQYIPNQRLS